MKHPRQLTEQEAGTIALKHDLEQAEQALRQSPRSDTLIECVADLKNTLDTGAAVHARGHYWQVKHALDRGEDVPRRVAKEIEK